MHIVLPDDYSHRFGSPEQSDLRRLRPYGTITVYTDRVRDREEFFRRIETADIVINCTLRSIFDREAFEHAPKLRMISFIAVSPNNIDLKVAERVGVTVCNLPGVNCVAVAEFSIGLMLAVARGIGLSDRDMRRGVWTRPRGHELRGKVLGVLGLGAIGSEVARMGLAMGMQVIAWSRRHDPDRANRLGVQLVDFDDLFHRADVVSVHLRSISETHAIVRAREFALMKPTAILINTARAAIVDQGALLSALRDRRIAGAGLDVHDSEPLPLEANPFRDMDNVVQTAHIGTETQEFDETCRRGAVENVAAFLEGRPRNVLRA